MEDISPGTRPSVDPSLFRNPKKKTYLDRTLGSSSDALSTANRKQHKQREGGARKKGGVEGKRAGTKRPALPGQVFSSRSSVLLTNFPTRGKKSNPQENSAWKRGSLHTLL